MAFKDKVQNKLRELKAEVLQRRIQQTDNQEEETKEVAELGEINQEFTMRLLLNIEMMSNAKSLKRRLKLML